MRKLLLTLFLPAASAFAQENPSAYEALRTIGTELNRQLVNRVVSISGVDGDPQPRTWKILVEDRNATNGVREIVVEDNRVVSQRSPNRSVTGSSEGATINTAKLNLDSTGAYSVASHTAETSHVTFSLTSYMLRTDDRGNPIWVVSLSDRSNRPVGTIHIRASDGRVMRVQGMYQGRNMEQFEENREEIDNPPSTETDEPRDQEIVEDDETDENLVFKDVKRMFRRTTRDASRIFFRVRRSFVDFFNR
ncbi:MAG TPA: hypothetical protein VM940_10655 [Chthoniobacterales bacterium]|jgi:hypothetical protein|nr:hypothetical protein [Chthoniobacterales bacterium]